MQNAFVKARDTARSCTRKNAFHASPRSRREADAHAIVGKALHAALFIRPPQKQPDRLERGLLYGLWRNEIHESAEASKLRSASSTHPSFTRCTIYRLDDCASKPARSMTARALSRAFPKEFLHHYFIVIRVWQTSIWSKRLRCNQKKLPCAAHSAFVGRAGFLQHFRKISDK